MRGKAIGVSRGASMILCGVVFRSWVKSRCVACERRLRRGYGIRCNDRTSVKGQLSVLGRTFFQRTGEDGYGK